MEIQSRYNKAPRGGKEQLSFFDGDPTEDSLTSDRLKKAIERNRSKRSRRGSSTLASRGRSRGLPNSSPVDRSGNLNSSRGVSTRARVGRQEDTGFNDQLRRERRLPAGRVDYIDNRRKSGKISNMKSGLASKLRSLGGGKDSVKTKAASVSRLRRTELPKNIPVPKRSTVKGKWPTIFAKVCWGVCLVAMLRLLFSDGGVVDFYGRTNEYNDLVQHNVGIMSENIAVQKNIERIRFDHSYQKELVREHLSYISNDEYLILFAR